MVRMIINPSTLRRSTADQADSAEQLTLLPNDCVTARFRLSQDTRERGLRHVDEIRRMLAERVAPISIATTDAQLRPPNDQAA